MKLNKLKKFEAKTERVPSPEQIKQAREVAANMIMSVFDRLPANVPPVAESLEDLLSEVTKPKPKPCVVQSFDGRRLSVLDGVITEIGLSEFTKNDSSEATKNDSSEATKKPSESDTGTFTDGELLILEQIQNGST